MKQGSTHEEKFVDMSLVDPRFRHELTVGQDRFRIPFSAVQDRSESKMSNSLTRRPEIGALQPSAAKATAKESDTSEATATEDGPDSPQPNSWLGYIAELDHQQDVLRALGSAAYRQVDPMGGGNGN